MLLASAPFAYSRLNRFNQLGWIHQPSAGAAAAGGAAAAAAALTKPLDCASANGVTYLSHPALKPSFLDTTRRYYCHWKTALLIVATTKSVIPLFLFSMLPLVKKPPKILKTASILVKTAVNEAT